MQKFVIFHPLFLIIIEFLLIFGNLKEIKSDLLVKNDELQAIHESHQHHNLKFSNNNKGMKLLNKYERKGREIDNDEQEEFAIMYKDLLPVGIIQGSAGNYELLPVHENEAISLEIDPLIKTETRRDTIEIEHNNNAQFADEKYPYIFAKFKVDSKMEKGIKNQKREAESSTLSSSNENNHLINDDKLKLSALNKFENNDAGAESALKGVLNEMGLIDDDDADSNNINNKEIEKRNVELIEDEDLEHGTNKINLIKIDEAEAAAAAEESSEEKSRIKLEISTENYEIIQYPEPSKSLIKNEEKIVNNNNNNVEEFKQTDDKERDKRSKEFEQEMEQQIKEKLNKIKEEVKNEFDQLNIKDQQNEEEEEEENDDEKSERKKRNILGNLMEFENNDLLINPINVAEENHNLEPHIRRRRTNSDDHLLKINLLNNNNNNNNEEKKFQLRNLKSIISSDEKITRNKKSSSSCKCSSGKNCKCEKEKKSRMIYEDGKFRLNLHPDSYRISENREFLEKRRKRNDFLNLVAIHGGGPVLEHLLKIRERNLRNKRSLNNEEEKLLTLNNIAQEEIFGALPQNFEDGESLARFKRI